MHRLTSQFAVRLAVLSACAATTVFFSGCAGVSGTAPLDSLSISVPKGLLHGGQQPIQGSHIYLYAASTSGYGTASTSLITPGDAGTTTDTNGNAYVTTDSSGSFSYAGTATCPTADTQIYLLALGGNPTGFPAGSQNGAIALSAALGTCSSVGPSTFTVMNEVTTVAMAYALNAFMIDATHVASSSGNATGLKNAFATVNNLVKNRTGAALVTTPSLNGTAPQQYVNTLANIIASCVNSGAASSSACSQLFVAATTTSSAPPVNTLDALTNIAAFPAAQTATLYALSPAVVPFQPALSTQPNDLALGITFQAPTTVGQPGAVVIDAAGDIWMANCQSCLTGSSMSDSLLEFSPIGTYLNSYTGASALHKIKGIAIDAAGSYIYTVNQGVSGGPVPGTGDDQIVKMDTATGTVQSGFPVSFDQGTYGVDAFNGIAIDNSGQIWATAENAGALIESNPSGSLINGSPFFVGGTTGVGVDNSGSVWFAGTSGNDLLQFDTNGNFLNNFTPSGLDAPLGIAINGSNEIWTINQSSSSLSRLEHFNGGNGSGSPYTSLGLYQAAITAIDGANQVLIPNCRVSCSDSGSTLPDSLIRLSQSGTPNAGTSGVTYGVEVPSFSGIGGAAVDASGNVWVSNSVSGTLTEVVGYATPTIQPIAEASSTAALGQRP